MTREEAEKELCRLLEEAEADIQAGRTIPAEEVFAQLREAFAPRNIVYLTGDTHGRFERIVDFCSRREMDRENTFVILGDAGLNFYGGLRDALGKEQLAKLPCTFFCIHGNHEQRPGPELGYELSSYHGGQVWVQPQYPNLVFAIDGEVYDFCGHSCLVIGGAYSVDKYYRLAMGYGWWPDEQPSPQIKEKVERVLEERNWQVDVVFSHTCPLKYEPVEVFLPGIDQARWTSPLRSGWTPSSPNSITSAGTAATTTRRSKWTSCGSCSRTTPCSPTPFPSRRRKLSSPKWNARLR